MVSDDGIVSILDFLRIQAGQGHAVSHYLRFPALRRDACC